MGKAVRGNAFAGSTPGVNAPSMWTCVASTARAPYARYALVATVSVGPPLIGTRATAFRSLPSSEVSKYSQAPSLANVGFGMNCPPICEVSAVTAAVVAIGRGERELGVSTGRQVEVIGVGDELRRRVRE